MSTSTVRVVPLTITLAPGQEPSVWYGECVTCNWYGRDRRSREGAKADADRHRRSHKVKR